MEGNAQAAASTAWVAHAYDGDVEALYRDHRLPVLKLAYVPSGSWQVAEEVTQESFLRLLDRGARGQIVNPAGWVRTVAANLARSRVRRLSAEVRAIARLSGQRREPATLDAAGVDAEDFWALGPDPSSPPGTGRGAALPGGSPGRSGRRPHGGRGGNGQGPPAPGPPTAC